VKIDFVRTARVVEEMMREAISTLTKEHPQILIKKVTLWGYGFGKCAHLLLKTSDDASVFSGKRFSGRRFFEGRLVGEYSDNEYASSHFDKWWPDLYKCPEGEPYQIRFPDGTVFETIQSDEGNAAIDRPLFMLLKKVMKATDFSPLNRIKPLPLAVVMGDSALAEEWLYHRKPRSSKA
jgi:hypothetical protein